MQATPNHIHAFMSPQVIEARTIPAPEVIEKSPYANKKDTDNSESAKTDSGPSIISPDLVLRETWRKREAELILLHRYKDDWDGLGAIAPGPELVDGAVAYLRDWRQHRGPVPDIVVASPRGNIVIIWRSGDDYMEAELLPDGTIDWLFDGPQGTRSEQNSWQRMVRH